MKKNLIILAFLGLILGLGGCSKKFKLERSYDLNSPEYWPYPNRNIEAKAAIESDYSGALNLIWEDQISDKPIGPLTIGVGRLIASGSKRHIYFYGLNSGKYAGKYNINKNSETGVVISDSLGYYGISFPRNEFVCINLFKRKKLWSRRLKDVSGSPIIIDNRLYVAAADGNVLCLDKMTGQTIWKDSIDAISVAGFSGEGDIVVVPFNDGRIKGYNAATGEEMFTTSLERPLMKKAVIGSDIYVTGTDGSLSALSRKSGKPVWSKEYDYPVWTSPSLDNGMLYFGDNGGNFRAVRTSDGSVAWSLKTDGVINANAVVHGDNVLFGTLNGYLYCLDKKDGTVREKRELDDEVRFPVIGDKNHVYVISGSGRIYCFGDHNE